MDIISKWLFKQDAWLIFILGLLPYIFTAIGIESFTTAILVVYMVMFLKWLFDLGVGLYAILPKSHSMNIKRFYGALIFLLLPFLLMIYLLLFGMNFDSSVMLGLQAPLNLMGFACAAGMFYIIYFLSKTLNLIEQDGNGLIINLMAWVTFFPLGLWYLQPKIKKLLGA